MNFYTGTSHVLSCWCSNSPSQLLNIPDTRVVSFAFLLDWDCSTNPRSRPHRCSFHSFRTYSLLFGPPPFWKSCFLRRRVFVKVSTGPRLPPQLWRTPGLKYFLFPTHLCSTALGHLKSRIQSCQPTIEILIAYINKVYIYVLSLISN
jgi:hypothetical protein